MIPAEWRVRNHIHTGRKLKGWSIKVPVRCVQDPRRGKSGSAGRRKEDRKAGPETGPDHPCVMFLGNDNMVPPPRRIVA